MIKNIFLFSKTFITFVKTQIMDKQNLKLQIGDNLYAVNTKADCAGMTLYHKYTVTDAGDDTATLELQPTVSKDLLQNWILPNMMTIMYEIETRAGISVLDSLEYVICVSLPWKSVGIVLTVETTSLKIQHEKQEDMGMIKEVASWIAGLSNTDISATAARGAARSLTELRDRITNDRKVWATKFNKS